MPSNPVSLSYSFALTWSARGCVVTDSPGASETGHHFVPSEADVKNLQVISGNGFRFFILFPTDYTASKSIM